MLTPIGKLDIGTLSNPPAVRVFIRQQAEHAIAERHRSIAQTAGARLSPLLAAPPGYYQLFENGAIYVDWNLKTYFIGEPIHSKYRSLNGEKGVLGFPITDQSSVVGGGLSVDFERGSICHHPFHYIGTHEVHGAIALKWYALGRESFGFPSCDEVKTVDGRGRINHFRTMGTHHSYGEEKSIYWTSETGAWELFGPIRDAWANQGWQDSYLRYPTSPIIPLADGSGQLGTFERGLIIWRSNTGEIFFKPDERRWASNRIEVDDTYGWVELVINSAGNYTYKGHFYNDNSSSRSLRIISILELPTSGPAALGWLAAEENIELGGALGTREGTWESNGKHERIEDVWDNLDSLNLKTSVSASGIPTLLLEAIVISLGVGLMISSGIFLQHSESLESHTCPDGHTVYIPKGRPPPKCENYQVPPPPPTGSPHDPYWPNP